MPNGNRPEHVIRIGFVSASVFARKLETEGGSRTIRNVVLQRRYVDGEETKYSSSFSLAELPQAAACLQLALDYVASREAAIELGE